MTTSDHIFDHIFDHTAEGGFSGRPGVVFSGAVGCGSGGARRVVGGGSRV